MDGWKNTKKNWPNCNNQIRWSLQCINFLFLQYKSRYSINIINLHNIRAVNLLRIGYSGDQFRLNRRISYAQNPAALKVENFSDLWLAHQMDKVIDLATIIDEIVPRGIAARRASRSGVPFFSTPGMNGGSSGTTCGGRHNNRYALCWHGSPGKLGGRSIWLPDYRSKKYSCSFGRLKHDTEFLLPAFGSTSQRRVLP